MKKKLALLLCLVLLVTALALPASADNSAAWDGSVDTSWYSAEAKTFEISTPAQLAGLAAIVNGKADGITADNFAGKTVTLTADLDLGGVKGSDGTWSGQAWTPIGNSYGNSFMGLFNGNGHAISNYYLNVQMGSCAGLFGYLDKTAIVKNLRIVSGAVNTTGTSGTGSIVGIMRNGSMLLNCANSASVTSNSWNTGGIVGEMQTGSSAWNCYNTGTVTASRYVIGGIAGVAHDLYNCYNLGDVRSEWDNSGTLRVGGIAGVSTGYQSSDTKNILRNCYNAGKITTLNGNTKEVGLIIGNGNNGSSWSPVPVTLTNCWGLQTDAINAGLFIAGDEKTNRAGNGAKNDAELKAAAATLGGAYADNAGSYPQLAWQIKDAEGKYGYDAELKGLAIASLDVTNGSAVLTLNRLLSYTPLDGSAFTFTAAIQTVGEAAAPLELNITGSALGQNEAGTATTFTYSFTPIHGKFKDSTVTFSAVYADNAAVTAQMDLPTSTLWTDYAADAFAGGDGSATNPYQIATAEQLAYLAKTVNAGTKYAGQFFIQTADIDLTESKVVGNGAKLAWEPIGATKAFSGNYNGDNFKITNMTIDGQWSYAGLFGLVSYSGAERTSARLANINLENVQIHMEVPTSLNVNVAGLAGQTSRGDIRNCHVLSGAIECNGGIGIVAGGLVGNFMPSANGTDGAWTRYLINSSSEASVSTTGWQVGGLAGCISDRSTYGGTDKYMGAVIVRNCYATGDVTGQQYVGGLIGWGANVKEGEIHNCYASGNVTVTDNGRQVGGLLGYGAEQSNPSALQVTGNVAMGEKITGVLKDGVTAGRVVGIGTSNGENSAITIQGNYALDSMYVINMALTGGADNYMGIAKTKAELQQQATWEGIGFDFGENGAWTWDTNAQRPVLKGTKMDYPIEIMENPKDAVAFADQNAVAYAAAAGGMGDLTYQWQISRDNGESWKNLSGQTDTKLDFAASLRYDGALLRCEVTDTVGTKVYTQTANLRVYDADVTAKDVAAILYADYAKNGMTVTHAAMAARSYQKDISQLQTTTTWRYTYESKLKDMNGQIAWAAMDAMARGINPILYPTTGYVPEEITNLIVRYQNQQTAAATGGFYPNAKYNNSYYLSSNIQYIMALDMFFGGSDWNNENLENGAGREAAFNFMLSLLHDDDATSGRYFASKTNYRTKVDGTGGSRNAAYAMLDNANFALLMARFTGDEKLGKEATSAFFDVMTVLNAGYDGGAMGSNLETKSAYLSALVEAKHLATSNSKKADFAKRADTVYEELLSKRNKYDLYDSAQYQAAALMAISDYANDRAILATFTFDYNVQDLLQADLNAIEIPATVLEDFSIPAKGANGAALSMVSSNQDVITNDGKVTRPAVDTTVVLTITAQIGEEKLEKEFAVKVAAERGAGGDNAYQDAEALSLLPEYLTNLPLAEEGAHGSAITWTSSMPEVIAADGTLTRPAIGQPDANVTLTASVQSGESVETRTFNVKVWANVDTATTEGMVKEAYYQTRASYMRKTILNGYWDVWGAYAALGDQIRDFDYTYDTSNNSAGQPGAHILAIVQLGENPYDYQGVNYVAKMKEAGVSGMWSVPVFNTLGIEAAGVSGVTAPMDPAVGWATSFSMGPDIGGWAATIVANHLDRYSNTANIFVTNVAENMAKGLSGAGTSSAISKGCVVLGLSALHAAQYDCSGIAGVSGLNVAKDTPWINQDDGHDAVAVLYNSMKNSFGSDSIGAQIPMYMCDAYNAIYGGTQVGWLSCAVSKARLDAQIAKANEILANKALYTADSVKAIEDAMEVVKGISEERLNAKVADYGEEYYALYDAVRFVKTAQAAAADQAAADKVAAELVKLPAAEDVTLESKDAIVAARAAFDALTETQQALVSKDALEKLTAAEDALAKLEAAEADKAAAANVEETINALPAAADITLENKEAVAAARAAFNALTEAQQALVSKDAQDKLTACEARIAELEKPEKPTDLPFTDLTQDWYMDSIRYVYEHELMYGTTDTTFAPDDALTRGMFVTMLYRMEGKPEATGNTSFTDVPAGAYYADAVAWASANGVVYGTSETAFSPEGKITREQMAAMMRRYASFKKLDTSAKADLSTFTDASAVSAWATGDMQWAVASELLYGNNHNQLQPTANATRAQAAAILQRFATKIVK